jgi:hypothetical protein
MIVSILLRRCRTQAFESNHLIECVTNISLIDF